MDSSWQRLTAFSFYLVLLFIVSEVLEMPFWSQYVSTTVLDPLSLSVRQIKRLLEARGVVYVGAVEKHELTSLLESSGTVTHGDIVHHPTTKSNAASSEVSSRFTSGSHFHEEVEDNKDSVWLVQVIPAKHVSGPMLDDRSWLTIVGKVTMFGVRTGIFDCSLDPKYCMRKGWRMPHVILGLPKGSQAKDQLVVTSYTTYRPLAIIDFVKDQLSKRIATISSEDELLEFWLCRGRNVTTDMRKGGDVTVTFLSDLIHPPLFLAALAIKFSGRIKFGMYQVKKEDREQLRQKLKMDRFPVYIITTPEGTLVYGKHPSQRLTFTSMKLFLKMLKPDMNDVFLLSLKAVMMLSFIELCLVRGTYWKHLIRSFWWFIKVTVWLFLFWLLVLSTSNFTFMKIIINKLSMLTRLFAMSSFGALVHSSICHWSMYPVALYTSSLLFGVNIFFLSLWINVETNEDSDSNSPWWNIFPMDSYVLNYLFRPRRSWADVPVQADFDRDIRFQLPVEQFHIPNLWLQPVVKTDYIKELPTWHFHGWNGVEATFSSNSDSDSYCDDDIDAASQKENYCSSCSYYNFTEYIGLLQQCKDCKKLVLFSQEEVKLDQSSCLELHSRVHRDTTAVESLFCSCNESSHDNTVEIIRSQGQYYIRISSSDRSQNHPVHAIPCPMCAICLEKYRSCSLLCCLPCGHSYHEDCIMTWLERDNHHCPKCRWPTNGAHVAHPHEE